MYRIIFEKTLYFENVYWYFSLEWFLCEECLTGEFVAQQGLKC